MNQTAFDRNITISCRKFNPSIWTKKNILEKLSNLFRFKSNVTFMSANIHKTTLGNYSIMLKMGMPSKGIKVIQADNSSLLTMVDQTVDKARRLLNKINQKEKDYKTQRLLTLT